MRSSVGSLALGLFLGGALSAAAAFGLSFAGADDLQLLLTDPLWWGQALLPGALAGIVIAAMPRAKQAVSQTNQDAASPAPKSKPRKKRRRRNSWLTRRLMAARLTAEGRFLDVSLRFARRLGRSRSKLRGVFMAQLVIAADRDEIEKALAEAMKRGESRAAARFLVTLSGSQTHSVPRRVLRLTLRRSSPAAGKAATFHCVFFDATTEAKLLRANQRLERQFTLAKRDAQHYRQDLRGLKRSYHDLYHHAPIMYFSLDALERLIGFNDTLVRTLGTPREQLAMRPYREVLAVDALDQDKSPFPLTADKEEETEAQWRRHDGAALDVWVRSQAVYDSSGSFVRWRCSAIDLTERNRLAHQLRSHTQELERTNARLRHINSELEDFTHVVSHDLKEPLRTLQAFSHILAEDYAGQLGPDGFEYINHLVQASRRLGVLIDDLLALSQAGRMAKTWAEFDLIKAVATVRRDLADMIQRKNAIVLNEGSLPTVVGDSQRITQLLTNLVANGLKYNENPTPTILVGAAANSEPGFATVYVRDNGIGIDPANHEQIFGIFRRLHPEGQYEGTGAGLAICKKIVAAHGGRVWVESQPGEGATFYFTLPLPKQAGAPAASPADLSVLPPSEASDGDSLHGVRLLMVEDLPEVGAIIRKLGERVGLKIDWFLTAEEAWHHLQKDQPDFALLDMNLPGMDGIELCRKIRRELHWSGPIALFSQETPETTDLLKDAGANFFITKELLSRPAEWKVAFHGLVKRSLKSLPAVPALIAPEPAAR
ncbi:MAG: response regulator [Gemmataceae bacterium]|nr:response regulator [Gemmataceae bacterium]